MFLYNPYIMFYARFIGYYFIYQDTIISIINNKSDRYYFSIFSRFCGYAIIILIYLKHDMSKKNDSV